MTTGELWASSLVGMNDWSEVHYAVSILESVWQEADKDDLTPRQSAFLNSLLSSSLSKSIFDQCFIVCASKIP